MRHHGVDPRRGSTSSPRRVQAMQAIWTEDEASYAGEHVSFERIWCWPKPVQRPHPPVLVGGNGATCSTGCWPSATRGSPTTPQRHPRPGRGIAHPRRPAGRAAWSRRPGRPDGAGTYAASRDPAGHPLAAVGSAQHRRAGNGPVRGRGSGVPRRVTGRQACTSGRSSPSGLSGYGPISWMRRPATHSALPQVRPEPSRAGRHPQVGRNRVALDGGQVILRHRSLRVRLPLLPRRARADDEQHKR